MSKGEQQAQFYQPMASGVNECLLCPKHCHIAEGKTGICLARKNIEGVLVSLNYGVCSGEALDQIEKKPAEWLSKISPQIPLHLTRYFPCHDMAIPATPIHTLEQLKKLRVTIYSMFIWEIYNGPIPLRESARGLAAFSPSVLR